MSVGRAPTCLTTCHKRAMDGGSSDEDAPSWEAPRRPFGGGREADGDSRELLPVRQEDGRWKQRSAKKRAPPAPGEDAEEAAAAAPPPSEASRALAAAADEVATVAATRSRIAKLGAQILENPHKHIGLTSELLQHATARQGASPATQRMALLSAAAVVRDLIPAYRIRLPTEKELKMQVSKEVAALRDFEKKLLAAYEKCVELLRG